jgi:hypothetical protein
MLILERPHCWEWIATEPEEIVEDLARDVSRGVELIFRCKFPSDYVADGKLACLNETLMFEGRMISTYDRDSSASFADFEKWISSGPSVIARGELLKVISSKTTSSSDGETPNTDGDANTKPPTISINEQETEQSISLLAPVVGAVGGVGIIALLVAVVVGAILCHRQRSKSSMSIVMRNMSATNPISFADETSPKTYPSLPAMGMECEKNPLTQAPAKKQSQSDYQLPAAADENTYENPESMLSPYDAGLCNPTYGDVPGEGKRPDVNEQIYCQIRDGDEAGARVTTF